MFAKILTKQQIDHIHQASLTILERTGVIIPHEEMLSRFAKHGANVDIKARHVKIPSELVMELEIFRKKPNSDLANEIIILLLDRRSGLTI